MPNIASNLQFGDEGSVSPNGGQLTPSKPGLKFIVAQVEELAVLPHVVFKVLELSGSTDNSTQEIERAISVDPGFSSKVLILVNSAAYALPKKVVSIREALMFLGYKSVRQLAMTVGVFDMFVGKNDSDSLRRRAWWRHSVDTAVCARWLAEETKKLSGDDAYTCGLLHCIGKTLLDRFGVADYKHVEEMITFGIKDFKAEEAVYGCNHMEVAAAAVKKWGLPPELVSGLDYAHACDETEPFRLQRACTALASHIATHAVEGSSGATDDDTCGLPLWALAIMGIPEDRAGNLVVGGTAAIAAWNIQL